MSDINQSNETLNIDKSFSFSYSPEGIFVTVTPTHNVDKNQLTSKVFERVLKKNIKNPDKAALNTAIAQSNGRPVKFAEPQEEVTIDSSLSITLSSDRMTALLIITPPDGGKDLILGDYIRLIQSKGIIFGVDLSIVQEMAKRPKYNESIVFAKGQGPVKGEDGRVELLVDIDIQKKPTILEDGSVDFHELHYVETVQKGQVVANVILPKLGTQGKNVLGQVIPAPSGKPAPSAKGKNVELVDNGTKLIAMIEGQVNYFDNKINILNVLEIPGDVDVSVGNIRFNGNVVVRGNVLTDFKIEATGNVEIDGVVEGASIKAGGDIILKRGIQGLNKGTLISEHDIVARYMEHCTVTARNDIKSEAIMHCKVNAGHSVELGGKKGLIVGGTIKVGREINAKFIGSSMSTVTEIEIGVDPTTRERYKNVKEKISEYEKELKKIQQSIELLYKMKKVNPLPPLKQNMLNNLIKTKMQITDELPQLQQEVEEIESNLSEGTDARIKVQDTIYPGVRITIGSAMKFIKENTKYVIFYSDGADIKSMSLH